MTTILTGHVSPETAYVVNDYPYGFRLRCQIRYWLEYSKSRGIRLMTQTTNPKKLGHPWNKAKASTYSRFAMAMYLDDENHVQAAGYHEYMTGAECAAWREVWAEGVPEAARKSFRLCLANSLINGDRFA